MERCPPLPYRAAMNTILHIEHSISDYATWRNAFDSFAAARHEAGVLDERVARPVDDPDYIVVDLAFASTEQAGAFLAFLTDHVWASAATAPALVGRPRTALLRPEGGGEASSLPDGGLGDRLGREPFQADERCAAVAGGESHRGHATQWSGARRLQ